MAAPHAFYSKPRKLWEHRNPRETAMWKFMQDVNGRRGMNLESFEDLYDWSVGPDRVDFWKDVWETIGLIHEGEYAEVVNTSGRMDSVPYWFRGVRLNFAENLLYSCTPGNRSNRSTEGKEDGKVAVTEAREGGTEIRHLTWGELRSRVGRMSRALRAHGVGKGDRVAAVASNSIDTLVVYLATAAVGALFSSSSTDMGTKGVLDRLLQITPSWVFMDDISVYNGKRTGLGSKMRDILRGLKRVAEFKGLVVLPRFGITPPCELEGVPKAVALARFLEAAEGRHDLEFERVEFRDPFLVVYSSGTTGMPKCIVHSTGGVLLNAIKEGRLHHDTTPDDATLQYTTTGWIMYMYATLALLHGARVVLYDGSPFQPNMEAFIELAGAQKVSYLGVSPRYLHELQKRSLSPREIADLGALRSVGSTGMVLSDSLFEWFYDVGFPPSAQLSNISGGTDIAGCFGIENPLQPLYVGGCMGPSLGIKVEVYDSLVEGGKGVKGVPVQDGIPGELVATQSFPNQPVFLWGDETGETYFNAYFGRFDDVWTHGDFIAIHPHTRQILFMGRADGVLNPSGIRFGSAEIYSVIESYFPEVADSICVGQRRPRDVDESVMLFLLMAPGKKFTPELVKRVKETIGIELSKRHIPKWVFETREIPTTVNLKKVELPVKQIVSGQKIKPSGTLLNPQSLGYYYQFAEVEALVQGEHKL